MGTEYNLISLINILGLFQGLIMGFLLIISNKYKKKSTLFLGIFIILYTLEFIPLIIENTPLQTYYPRLLYLPFDFIWLLFPVFFIYVKKVSVISKKIDYKILYPGLLHVGIQLILLFFSFETQKAFYDSSLYSLWYLGGFIYSIWIAFKTIQWIRIHVQEVRNQFSYTREKELLWAKRFVVFGLIFILSSIFTPFIIDHHYVEVIYSIINVILLYWISFRGIIQKNVITTYQDFDIPTSLNNNSKEHKEISKKDKNIDALKRVAFLISTHLEKTEDFVKNDLTIIEVSNSVNEHPRKVSNAINTIFQCNFSSFINSYRVEKAKKNLLSKELSHLSIEGIGNEAGFKSKSAFYSAFKKEVGQTPLEFRNNNVD